jgi:hypothetical protein
MEQSLTQVELPVASLPESAIMPVQAREQDTMRNNTTLYATLRFRRRPISNEIVCFKLRVSHALPVHATSLHEQDISDYATMQDVNDTLAALAQQFKCGSIELDVKKDVQKRLESNAG